MNAHYASMLEADLGARMLKSVLDEQRPKPEIEGKAIKRKYISDEMLEARRKMVTAVLKRVGKATSKELSIAANMDAMETYNDLIGLCNDGIVDRKKIQPDRGHMRYVYWVADFNEVTAKGKVYKAKGTT